MLLDVVVKKLGAHTQLLHLKGTVIWVTASSHVMLLMDTVLTIYIAPDCQ